MLSTTPIVPVGIRPTVSPGVFYSVWGCLLLLWLALSWYRTQLPLGVGSDDAHYVMAAENLANGEGFLTYNASYNSEADKWVPLMQFQPGFSFCVAMVRKFLGLELMDAVRTVNFTAWVIFFAGWFNLFRLLLGGRSWFFLLACLSLVVSYGVWTYLRPALSDMLFSAVLVGVLNALAHVHRSDTWRAQWAWTLAAGLLTSGLVITRYAGLGFFAGLLVSFGLAWPRWPVRRIIALGGIYMITSLISFGLWSWRNWQISGTLATNGTGGGHPFTLPRALEVVNIFYAAALGVPAALEPYAFLLTLPLLAFVSYFLYRFVRSRTEVDTTLLVLVLGLGAYVAMIVYVGKDPAFNRQSGFQRYFYLAQPFVIAFGLYGLRWWGHRLTTFRPQWLAGAGVLFFAGLMAFYVFSSANRLHFFLLKPLYAVDKTEPKVNIYEVIRTHVPTNAFLMSNHSQNIKYGTGLDAREVGDAQSVRTVMTRVRQPDQESYLLLNKIIGYQVRIGAPKWDEIVPALPTRTVFEDEKYILVEVLSP